MATIPLIDFPDDIKKFVIKKQNKIKEEKCITQYSLQKVIYNLLREHPDFKKD